MKDLSEKTGIIRDYLTYDQMVQYKKYFSTVTPTKSRLQDDVYGIDHKNKSHYLWFKNTLLKKLQNTFRNDLQLSWAMFCKFTDSFKIHNDNDKNLPEPNSRSYIVGLIPFAVNGDPDQCYKSSTLIFTKEPNENYIEDHKKWLSNNEIDRVKNYKIFNIHEWRSGDLIWWKSEMDHAGSHFVGDIKLKECWSIHTYVRN